MAREAHARHQTVAALLRALGVPAAVAEVDAEGIEHHVSAQTLVAFQKFLRNAT
jgi:DtxR family manganese transport transcriptional regulator